MKPFYFGDFVVLVYASVHEEEDWLVLIRQEKYQNHYRRIEAKTAKEAAKKAFERFKRIHEVMHGMD